jgi:hypothetical protein
VNRADFNRFLMDHRACDEAKKWCGSIPEATPAELWDQCQIGDWMLWLCGIIGTPPPEQFAYDCANRAIMYAVRAMDAAGISHKLRWTIVVDRETAYAAASAARSAYARSADAAVYAAARSATAAAYAAATSAAYVAVEFGEFGEESWQAARLRELMPNPFVGGAA